MSRFLKSFPFLSAGVVQAALAFALALGAHLTPVQSGAIQAAAAAILALLVMPHVTPIPVPLLTGALTAIGTLLVAFRAPHVTPGLVSAAVAFLTAILSGFGHNAVENRLLATERTTRQRVNA